MESGVGRRKSNVTGDMGAAGGGGRRGDWTSRRRGPKQLEEEGVRER